MYCLNMVVALPAAKSLTILGGHKRRRTIELEVISWMRWYNNFGWVPWWWKWKWKTLPSQPGHIMLRDLLTQKSVNKKNVTAIAYSRRDLPYVHKKLSKIMYSLHTISPWSGRYSGQRKKPKKVWKSVNFGQFWPIFTNFSYILWI
jgi:hypothetical protein